MVRRLLTLAAIIAVGPGAPHAVQAPVPGQTYVAVTNADGAPIPGLSGADFAIRLDGKDVPVVSAVTATTPVALVFLTSGVPLEWTPGMRTTMRGVVAALRHLSCAV